MKKSNSNIIDKTTAILDKLENILTTEGRLTENNLKKSRYFTIINNGKYYYYAYEGELAHILIAIEDKKYSKNKGVNEIMKTLKGTYFYHSEKHMPKKDYEILEDYVKKII